MSDEDWDTITEEGVDLQDTYPFTDSQILSGQFHQWAAEDYDIAVEYVYPGKFSIFFPLKINILSLAFKEIFERNVEVNYADTEKSMFADDDSDRPMTPA